MRSSTERCPDQDSLADPALETGLLAVAEGREHDVQSDTLDLLVDLGLVVTVTGLADLSPVGERFYLARFVSCDARAANDSLADVLRGQAIATGFCSALWGTDRVQVQGAVSLLIRLKAGDANSAKRWLELMNRAGWVTYNRANSYLRIRYNPQEIVPPEEDAARERGRGHVIDPDTGYGNLVALRELLRSARDYIRWYEQHLPSKVLEILYREVDGSNVSAIRLLSGPANIDSTAKADFKRFTKEMKDKRGITVEWRVLAKKDAFLHHDRFFLSEGMARNLPPLNTILAGSTGEILPSDLAPAEFDRWWADGQPIGSCTTPEAV